MNMKHRCCSLILVLFAMPLILGCPPVRRGGGVNHPLPDNGASGVYDPATGLALETDGLALEVPPGAVAESVTLSVRLAAEADLPSPIPGDAGFEGGVFEPSGQAFAVPATVHVQLSAATMAPQLPVLTYNADLARWTGTGASAEVAENGVDVTFETDHFSLLGVPDAVPIPNPGDTIGSFLVVSNNGNLATDAISSDTAALIFSEFGDTFNIAATHQEINNEGHIETKAIGLDAILVTFADNYLVAVIGGEASIYNDGQFNEPLLGVVVLSLQGSTVNASIYAATPDRVIQGTLTGPVQ